MTLVPLKGSLGSGAWRRMAPIVSGQIYGSQRDMVSASRAVIVIVLQCCEGNARLGTTLGASYKCFTSCHTRMSFLSRAYPQPEKAFSSEIHSWNRLIFPYCVRKNRLDFKTPWYNLGIEPASLDSLFRRGALTHEKLEAPAIWSL
jgi:hypothetical protein